MDTIVTPGLVLKETRYKESDRIITLLTPGLGVISASAQSSLRLKKQTVQRLRAFLLLGVRACPRTEYVYSARGGCQKRLPWNLVLHRRG